MHFDLTTLGLQIANVLVLIWLLNRYLFVPLGARLGERREQAARALADVADAQTRCDTLALELKAAATEIARLKSSALSEARSALLDERKAILKSAENDARQLIEKATAAGREQINAMKLEVDAQAVNTSLSLLAALIAELPKAVLDDAYRGQLADWLGTRAVTTGPCVLHLADMSNQALWRTLLPNADIIHAPDLIVGAALDIEGLHAGFNPVDRIAAIRAAVRHG
jgi:F0F1-type ATP synthase membrane subunit b/b'